MMNDDCRRTAERLTPYVDNALSAGEQADVERHLSGCPPCRQGAARESSARAVLREQAGALTAIPLPPGLRSRCQALASEHGRASAPPVFAARRFAPLTALITLVIGFLLFSLATHRSDTVLAAQLTADHAKCMRLFAKNMSPDADARRIEQMLESDHGWDLHVPPSSSAAGVSLLGARRCLYADGSIPHVMYRVDEHDVSLFVLDGVRRRAADLVALGHRSRVWAAGRRTYVLVWPIAAGEMTVAARYLMEEAR